MAGAIAVADELSQNLRDQFLQCKVCLDGLKEPKTLPCLHTFCAECIQCYITQNSQTHDGRNAIFSCPICRRHIFVPKDGASGFPDSFFVRSLSDALVQSSTKQSKTQCAICKFKDGRVEAKVICIECRVEICDSCASDHLVSPLTESHTLLQLFAAGSSSLASGVNRENYCRLHKGETVKYYCETCNSPVCLPCTFLDHRGHSINEIRRVRQQFVGDIETLVVQSEDNILQLQSARDDLAELENELFLRKEAIKTQIRRTLQVLVKSINEREAQLVGEVEAYYDTVPVSIDRQKVEKTIYRLQRAHDFARQLMSAETSPITQLVNRSEAQDNLRQAQVYDLPDLTVHMDKLDSSITFMPGNLDRDFGMLLKCSGSEGSKSCLVPKTVEGAVNKAIFLYGLRKKSSAQRSGDVTFSEIVTVAFLPNNDCAVLGTAKKFIKIFETRTGLLRSEFGDDDEESMVQPADMTVTRDGDLAIVDCGLLCVKVFDTQGSLQMNFGSDEIFALPIAIAIDSIGRFLVCDQTKQRITVHRQHGELLLSLDICELAIPQDICTYGNKLYVADSINNELAIFTYGKDGLEFVGKLSSGTSSPDFLDCSGICIDRTGNLLVSDSILNRIHVFSPTSGELGSLVSYGRAFHRSSCLAVSADGLLAVYQQRGADNNELDTSYDGGQSDGEAHTTTLDSPTTSNLDESTTQQHECFSDLSDTDCFVKHEVAVYRLLRVDF